MIEVVLNKQSLRPTGLQFQNGELLENEDTSLSSGLYTNDTNNTIPVLASETLIYTGQVVEQHAYNTFIGIRNKKTNKIKLIQINEAFLKPQPPKLREIMDSTMMEVNKQALTDLNKEFGSKRTKRQTETLERLKVNVDNYKDQLEKTVANISLEGMDIDNTEQTSDILPYINKNAEVIADVYTLKKLIPEGVLISLGQPANELLAADEAMIQTNESIKKQILALQSSDEDDTVETVVMLLVLDALHSIYTTPAKDLSRPYQASPYSGLNNFIMQTFVHTVGNRRTRPLAMKDKACCYIIILSLLLKKNKVNLEEMAIDLKMSLKKLNDLCAMLFLHVKGKQASVQLPLPAPRIFVSKAKKGKGRK